VEELLGGVRAGLLQDDLAQLASEHEIDPLVVRHGLLARAPRQRAQLGICLWRRGASAEPPGVGRERSSQPARASCACSICRKKAARSSTRGWEEGGDAGEDEGEDDVPLAVVMVVVGGGW
jgi:hypothetical protein